MASSSIPSASESWHGALKLRKHLLKHLDKLQTSNAPGVDVAQFETIDSFLDRFRLACVSTIFFDFDYAVSENAEEALWLMHTSINAEYRRIVGRLKQSSHAVEKRKVEKMYNNFLRIAQKFYKAYIQRLSARYDIQELKRVAMGIEVEQLPTEDTISPVPEELRVKVLKSCHLTLIRLGDLTRYRIQAKHRGSGYESALAYYGLAHHLKPHSGFAFHQMGIVHLDQGNHLDVVYHFYRAWAVEKPHPNAKPNLESEFKALQISNNSSKSKPNASVPQDAMTMWFVRLHAQFYKGEAYGSKEDELEKEVMHRLEMVGRNEAPVHNLLKMALVNMSAQHIAASKYREKQTEAASRFYQYALRFNVRFILTFCGVLEAELNETSSVRDVLDTSDAVAKPSVVESLLPVLRTYCIWLAAHRQEMFGAVDAFGSLIPNMIQNLARVFTLLCVETYNQQNLKTAPYMLMEDIEISGFRPLSDNQVPEGCRFFYGEDGNSKPYPPSPEQRLDAQGEKAARILDILRCAYFFTEDEAVPLTYRIESNTLVFEYQPVTEQKQPIVTAAPSSNHSDKLTASSQQKIKKANGQIKPAPTTQVSVTEAPQTQTRSEVNVSKPSQEVSSNSNYELSCDMDDADSTVINMLTPFLKPPTPQPQQHPRSPAESSYGMHTHTANELFASFDVEPTPTKSIPSGKFEPLPWGWFNTPNPDKAQDLVSSAGKDAFNGHHSATQSPNLSIAAAKFPEDPFATPGRHSSGAFARNTAGDIGSPSNVATESAHRERLLQTFGKSSAPRSSSFSQWSQNPNPARQQVPAASAWGLRAFENVPFSSGYSGFSHPSSLYHGTPVNGSLYNAPVANDLARSLSQDAFHREAGQHLGRHFQIDETTSNYDEAILKAAYQGPR
ncbi:Nonsense-mediated mRNA decay factor SMG7-like protein [Cladobotryum mycophilum]|uniref:Nonsense-mediated mRNA decay factor n=1 Tax=Cladobotryum mycophilum TaxID=491253 RepID=A0ABR0SEK3_9HYPO